MALDAPELAVHKEWLGQIQQVGLVVSPHVLAKHNVGVDRQRSIEKQARLREIAETGESTDADEPRIDTFLELASEILEWPDDLLLGAPAGPKLPESLTVALPEYDDLLSPTYAIPGLALISIVATSADLDKPLPDQKSGWRASPHARLERLLRETAVPSGLLFNHTHLRLIYAPRGESSGHLTFRFKHLLETLGRPMAGALYTLLGMERVTDVLPDALRLPALLKESRKYQNVVSTKLAGQVLEALWQLLRGFQRANDETNGALLAEALRENPQEVYGGLLSTLMRLVFILYAEDRGLMPASDVYQKHYAVSGLFERLREDAARYPDTMDARFGAWAQLLALFRLIHDGGSHDDFRFPPRHGRLFNPDAYPFLEGRPLGSTRVMGVPIDPPRVPDGVVFRVLQNLLMLDGERLSYRALDVEQIGSVYEAMMGFALQQATGPSIAVRPKHIVVNLVELLEQKPQERAAWLQKQAELKVTGEALAKATTVEEALVALAKKVSREYTPAPLAPAVMYLQPTEERRRSGSHYTPRSLTAPIVQTTFRPILERLGDQATSEQILDLKVCDPAMGSGAFLVEACRVLAERLVRAWEVHKVVPKVPDDEDVLTYAKRLVAEGCLYGVDKNVFAVDLAKLSLWLTTLAREHPFTFLDHALRHGDSLVGLTREQIACFNWVADRQLPLLRGLIDERVKEAQGRREQIQGMATSDDVPAKARLLKEANEALDDVRRIGDLVVSAFFECEKPKDRHSLRTKYSAEVQSWVGNGGSAGTGVGSGFSRTDSAAPLTFHWEIEFPEVFTRTNPGFDAFVGNPPFAGVTQLAQSVGPHHTEWLRTQFTGTHGKCDLVAFFFRRVYQGCRVKGTIGLIATKTIAQGDTRTSGLAWLVANGALIYEADKRIPWPGTAAVIVSRVHLMKKGSPSSVVLNDRPVEEVNSFLLPAPEHAVSPLRSNAQMVFLGAKPGRPEFLLSSQERDAFDQLLPDSERDAIRPYLVTSSIYGDPGEREERWALAIGLWDASRVARYPAALQLLGQRLSPLSEPSRAGWWKFSRPAAALNVLIAQRVAQVIVKGEVSDTFAFIFAESQTVFSNKIVVWVSDDPGLLSVLQSRVHEVWARLTSSTFGDGLSYVPSDSFVTFALPIDWESDLLLKDVGRACHDFRAALLIHGGEGLTKIYNRFHDPAVRDPEIVNLRDLHVAMDRAVLDAYGWTDIQTTCEFILDYEDDADDTNGRPSRKKKPWRYRWPDEIRDEVLGRLLELNAQRAREEQLQVSRAPGSKTRKSTIFRASNPLLDT